MGLAGIAVDHLQYRVGWQLLISAGLHNAIMLFYMALAPDHRPRLISS